MTRSHWAHWNRLLTAAGNPSLTPISAQLVEISGQGAMHVHGQRGMSPRNNHGCRHARLAVSFEKKTDSTGRGLRLRARGFERFTIGFWGPGLLVL